MNLDIYVSTTGSDSNPGTLSAPLRTVDRALAVAELNGWLGYCRIHVAAGTYLLGSKLIDVPESGGVGTEPPVLMGDFLDVGGGNRAIAVSTVGQTASPAAFGTIQDTVGGWAVNQFRDRYVRLTGAGTHVGKRFQIASNTANTLTLAGLFVAVTTETYVIEEPATVLTAPGPDQFLFYGGDIGAIGCVFGDAVAGGVFNLRGGTLFHQACWFREFSTIPVENNASIATMWTSDVFDRFPSLNLLNDCGSAFFSSVASAAIIVDGGGVVRMSNCELRIRTSSSPSAEGDIVLTTCHFAGNAGQGAFGNTALQLTSCVYDACSFVSGDSINGVIVCEGGGSARVINCTMNACTANAIGLAGSADAIVQGLAGNNPAGGIPLQVRFNSTARKLTGNAIVGAAAGADVQVGNGAAVAWAAAQAAPGVNDQAAAFSEFCYAGPN